MVNIWKSKHLELQSPHVLPEDNFMSQLTLNLVCVINLKWKIKRKVICYLYRLNAKYNEKITKKAKILVIFMGFLIFFIIKQWYLSNGML